MKPTLEEKFRGEIELDTGIRKFKPGYTFEPSIIHTNEGQIELVKEANGFAEHGKQSSDVDRALIEKCGCWGYFRDDKNDPKYAYQRFFELKEVNDFVGKRLSTVEKICERSSQKTLINLGEHLIWAKNMAERALTSEEKTSDNIFGERESLHYAKLMCLYHVIKDAISRYANMTFLVYKNVSKDMLGKRLESYMKKYYEELSAIRQELIDRLKISPGEFKYAPLDRNNGRV